MIGNSVSIADTVERPGIRSGTQSITICVSSVQTLDRSCCEQAENCGAPHRGSCFDSDNCYGLCPDNAMIKLGPGKRFGFNLRFLRGLRRLRAGPCGTIVMGRLYGECSPSGSLGRDGVGLCTNPLAKAVDRIQPKS
jgi:hypothetical protein